MPTSAEITSNISTDEFSSSLLRRRVENNKDHVSDDTPPTEVSESSSLSSSGDEHGDKSTNEGIIVDFLTVPQPALDLPSLTDISRTASGVALSSLALSSHKQFKNFIHKHEIPRKFLHVSIGFFGLELYRRGFDPNTVTPHLIFVLIVISCVDFIRFNVSKFNRLYCKYFGFLMREKEVSSVNGVIWYLLGVIIVLASFPKDIVMLSLLLLSWADTAASTFGRAYGYLTPKFNNKSLAGSMAAFVIGLISAITLYGYFIPKYTALVDSPGEILWNPETSRLNYYVLVFLSGLVGAVSEAVDLWNMDDNFTIPVISGTFMWAIIKICAV
ncbi:hypothetical protein NADFUDRAFT_83957 [Nadsonia fulvescens var. elongata DSM 6958]|uniref:Phosphatidate cytidylyltransferase n=1 Tax=Nadsonia fulvescens var. elongata DSM 6958 TaxID=857566 RepID=A0A1E3PEM0_9ASCO|nr:hypothetical protein NADFUDRAFT_83957 [Nadsonia fulvescens var. elongata DSM 6958]